MSFNFGLFAMLTAAVPDRGPVRMPAAAPTEVDGKRKRLFDGSHSDDQNFNVPSAARSTREPTDCMTIRDPICSLPSREVLLLLVQRFLDDKPEAGPGLRDVLSDVFCTCAAGDVPVERALALVNTALDDVSPARINEGGSRFGPLRRLVMECCLGCYFPAGT